MKTHTTTEVPTIAKVIVKTPVDYSPDTSCLGKYTDTYSDWAIRRDNGEFCCQSKDEQPPRGHEYRYFLPYARGEKPGTKHYKKYGKQDFARMESLYRGDWFFIGIYAQANMSDGHTFRSGGLWGIESDSGREYIEQVAREEIADLRNTLASYGVNTSTFDDMAEEAIQNIDEDAEESGN